MKLILILVVALGALTANADSPICVNNANLACIKDFYVFCINTHDKTITIGSTAKGYGSRTLRLHNDNISSFEGDLPGNLKIQADDEITDSEIAKYTLVLTPDAQQPDPDRLHYKATISAAAQSRLSAPEEVNCTTL